MKSDILEVGLCVFGELAGEYLDLDVSECSRFLIGESTGYSIINLVIYLCLFNF